MTSTNTNKGPKKGLIIAAVAAFAAVIVLMAVLYQNFSAKPVEGSKEITIEVVDNEQKSTVYELKTDAEYLRRAMEEAEGLTFSGDESQYGMMVMEVNGITVDYSKNKSYWGFFVNGEYCMSGIDTQPVNDGDTFQIVYTTD